MSLVSLEGLSFRVIVPVRNGGAVWRAAASALRDAIADPALVVVVDSDSTDGSLETAIGLGFAVKRIDAMSFNHGATRQAAVGEFARDRKFVVFLTQDAIIDSSKSLPALLGAFEDRRVGAAYGRQIPHEDATVFAAHAALFNYGPESQTKSIEDAARLGIKACWLSNSFAAYRVEALRGCGGFPDHLIVGEDVYVGMRMQERGHLVRYCADALVRHSHNNSPMQDARRYFDFGVMHAQLPVLLEHFGTPDGEGLRFLLSELRYVWEHSPWHTSMVPLRAAFKYGAYRLGRAHQFLPNRVNAAMSMTRGFWCTP